MLALLAAIVFFLGLIHVKLGDLSLTYLGLMLVSLHLAYDGWSIRWPVRRP